MFDCTQIPCYIKAVIVIVHRRKGSERNSVNKVHGNRVSCGICVLVFVLDMHVSWTLLHFYEPTFMLRIVLQKRLASCRSLILGLLYCGPENMQCKFISCYLLPFVSGDDTVNSYLLSQSLYSN